MNDYTCVRSSDYREGYLRAVREIQAELRELANYYCDESNKYERAKDHDGSYLQQVRMEVAEDVRSRRIPKIVKTFIREVDGE